MFDNPCDLHAQKIFWPEGRLAINLKLKIPINTKRQVCVQFEHKPLPAAPSLHHRNQPTFYLQDGSFNQSSPLAIQRQFVTWDEASKIIDWLALDGYLTKKDTVTVPNMFGKNGDSLNNDDYTSFGIHAASIGSVEGTVLVIRKLRNGKSNCAKLVGYFDQGDSREEFSISSF